MTPVRGTNSAINTDGVTLVSYLHRVFTMESKLFPEKRGGS